MAHQHWSPNPYAIAQQLTRRVSLEELSKDGRAADDFLKKAFKLEVRRQTMTEAFTLFRGLASNIERPMSLAQALEFETVKSSGFDSEQLSRVLSTLAPMTDVTIEPSRVSNGAETPSAVGAYADVEELVINRPHPLDPVQGDVADCYLISALIALAWAAPNLLEQSLRDTQFRERAPRKFEWQFHKEDGGIGSRISVSADVVFGFNDFPIYARSSTPDEFWPSMIEKAYVVMRPDSNPQPKQPDYLRIRFGATPQEACQSLVGGQPVAEVLNNETDLQLFSPTHELGLINAAGVTTRPVMAWTKIGIGDLDRNLWDRTGLWPEHAYAVLGVMPSGHIVLRNPHGVATEKRPGYAEQDEWAPAGQEPIRLNQNGVFALSQALFLENFGNMGWLDHEGIAGS